MKVVLLNSGGLDSALEAKRLKEDGYEVHSLFLEFKGQLGLEKIREAAKETADKFCDSHHTIYVDLGYIPNHWESVYGNIGYEEGITPDVIDGFTPRLWSGPENQSSVMISLAVSYAKRIGAETVYHGYYGSITPESAIKYKEAMLANGSSQRPKPDISINDSFKTKEEKIATLYNEKEFDHIVSSVPGVEDGNLKS